MLLPNNKGVDEGCVITGDDLFIACKDDISIDGVITMVLMTVTVTGSTTTGHDMV